VHFATEEKNKKSKIATFEERFGKSAASENAVHTLLVNRTRRQVREEMHF